MKREKPTCGNCTMPYTMSNGRCSYHIYCPKENKKVKANLYNAECKEKRGHVPKKQLQPGPEPAKKSNWPHPSRIMNGIKSDFETVIS